VNRLEQLGSALMWLGAGITILVFVVLPILFVAALAIV
jgi:hypothetical protein